MNRIALCLASALIVFALPTDRADAGSLATGVLLRKSTGQSLVCYVTNVASKSMSDVTVVLVSEGGVEHDLTTCSTVEPGDLCVANSNVPIQAFCRATFKGSAKSVRVSLIAYDLTTFEPSAALSAP